MRRTALWVAVGLGLVAALFVGVLATRDAAANRRADSPLLGQAAPPLAGDRLLGSGRFSLAAQEGRWVLVNFFATWCVPCEQEHPELVLFADAHTDDATVVSIVYDDEAERVRDFFADRGGDWAVVDDPSGRTALDWGVGGIPESFLVGPDGTVVYKLVGGVTADGLDSLLAEAQEAFSR